MFDVVGEFLSATICAVKCHRRSLQRRLVVCLLAACAVSQLVDSREPSSRDLLSKYRRLQWKHQLAADTVADSDDDGLLDSLWWRASQPHGSQHLAPSEWTRGHPDTYSRTLALVDDLSNSRISPSEVAAEKRRSVLGLDNLDFAASMLDLARNQNHGGPGAGTAGGSSSESTEQQENNEGGIISPGVSRGDGMQAAQSASSGGAVSASGATGGGSGSSGSHVGRLKISHHSSASTLVSPGSTKSHRGRLSSLSVSPQDLRKMMDIINAG